MAKNDVERAKAIKLIDENMGKVQKEATTTIAAWGDTHKVTNQTMLP